MAERNRRGGPRDQARGAASRAGAGKIPPGKQGQSIPPGKQGKPGAQGGKNRVTPRDAADGVDERAAQLAEPLRRVLQRLPETQRRVLELRMGLADGHPQDPADAARTLGMSLGELREIETRAFERIREVIPLQQLQRFLER
jgi:DNA-directed RNA polymerase specialized sigma24 family protein